MSKNSSQACDIFLGIDFGTTGCRIVAIDERHEIVGRAAVRLPSSRQAGDHSTQDPSLWWTALVACLHDLLTRIDGGRVKRLAVDGTSGTLLLCDARGDPVSPALMYDDRRATAEAERIALVADPACGAEGAGSSLAKLLWLLSSEHRHGAAFALHQADWITNRLTGRFGHSDYNNCLKLGYDAQAGRWPEWFGGLSVDPAMLPRVHVPGEVLGPLCPEVASAVGLSPTTQVVAGTTDGVASFLAAGATAPGDGVTALGTTLVLKLLSDQPVFSTEHGVYSHRLGERWLAGGASNSGGAVLLRYFSEEQLHQMTPRLDPERSTGLDYYPLPGIGERFPVNAPKMNPRLSPRPADPVVFLQGILEGVARIEAQGYELLASLGAPALARAWTTGGGSGNPAWTRIRERALGVRLDTAKSECAAYGTALLAAGIVREVLSARPT